MVTPLMSGSSGELSGRLGASKPVTGLAGRASGSSGFQAKPGQAKKGWPGAKGTLGARFGRNFAFFLIIFIISVML